MIIINSCVKTLPDQQVLSSWEEIVTTARSDKNPIVTDIFNEFPPIYLVLVD